MRFNLFKVCLLLALTGAIAYAATRRSVQARYARLVFLAKDRIAQLGQPAIVPLEAAIREGVAFEKVPLPDTRDRYSGVCLGPDGKLYATTLDGRIRRFTIGEDGTLQAPEELFALQDAYETRTNRLTIGLAFDPAATADSLVAWVTHQTYTFYNGPDWDGTVSRLSGPQLEHVQHVVIHLPRSAGDHLTNSVAFGPDGALYIAQGSNTAMGSPDESWAFREEHLLSAAILRLDPTRLTNVSLPLDVKTSEGGTYDPYAATAPLTIYASGLRNAYDLVWHSNGHLYVPVNGAAADGHTPASEAGALRMDGRTYEGPAVPALSHVMQVQNDYLVRVDSGGYYGHPNPRRGEFVMNGGNPTDDPDPAQVDQYPVGTQPDPNWRGFAFQFPIHNSPNGLVEYRSGAFHGALQGKLLVTRFVNQDLMILEPGGSTLDIVRASEGATVPGLTDFSLPIDVAEDVTTGNLYVAEFGGDGQITLLRPRPDGNPEAVVQRQR
ncbi:Glucose/arabinose dehydrogenase, beta-propeller fold [Catalinimonas alkaloidigena]|uniref:Glucose/arabinose dehydrogenase, beta-propeller fold n=1 Tax=Catalinimonas alkaloidigena TaxID=1075417 RepID=A0A1G9R8E9_9BACT|nr:PQQ-dependent sugar dehydrogenase [Catalinimonas alkaloidigena]SDM19566.1 Glucose/arabinose dehydrogenase, beta-propeller fold [Catalinimonas alkaloidigena]